MNVILGYSNLCGAMKQAVIGTKILCQPAFEDVVRSAIVKHDFATERAVGQGLLRCPEAIPFVGAGVGRRTLDCGAYVAMVQRGRVELFLKRRYAAPVEACSVVVYTKDAYLADPDVKADDAEFARILSSGFTHVIVAVLAYAGPSAPLTPYRLVHNLAGGNNEALEWSVDEIRAKATESKAYWDEWCVVADELPF